MGKRSRGTGAWQAPKRARTTPVGGSGKEADFGRFKDWLRATGFDWDDRDLDLRASGTVSAGGVFARRSIAVGKTAVRIPKSGCITWRTSSLASSLGATAAARRVRAAGPLADVPPNVKLILCLIHEIHLGACSPFAPYLATVPSCEAGIPLLWPLSEAQALLRGTELDEHCEFKRLELASEWHSYVEPLTRQYPALFPVPAFGLEEYAKKATLVSSRSFAIDSYHGPGMVPFADLFNHLTDGEHLHFTGREDAGEESGSEQSGDDHGEDEEGEDSENSEGDSECGKDELIMETVLPVQKGCEVFNTYGPIGSAPLLVRYGFCDTGNSHDFVSLSERHLVSGTLRWAAEKGSAAKRAAAKGTDVGGVTLDLARDAWDAGARLEFCRSLGFLSEAGPGCCESHVDLGADPPPDPQVLLVVAVMGLSEAAYGLLHELLGAISSDPIGPLIGKPALVFQEDNAQELKAVAILRGIVSGAISVRQVERPANECGGGRKTKAAKGSKQEVGRWAGERRAQQEQARAALRELLERCEIAVEGGSDSEGEGEGEEGTDGAEALIVDVNDLLTEEERPGMPEWLRTGWLLDILTAVIAARASALLRPQPSLASLHLPMHEWPALSAKGCSGVMVRGGEAEMLQWLAGGGAGGGYSTCLRLVRDGKEVAVGQVVEGKGRGAGVGVRVRELSARTASSRNESKVSTATFASVRAWVNHVSGVGGVGGETGGDGGGERKGRNGSKDGGKREDAGLWDSLFLGEWSLRECAERRAPQGGGHGGDRDKLTLPAEKGLFEGTGQGEGMGREERARLARQVRVNELSLLERMCQWVLGAAR